MGSKISSIRQQKIISKCSSPFPPKHNVINVYDSFSREQIIVQNVLYKLFCDDIVRNTSQQLVSDGETIAEFDRLARKSTQDKPLTSSDTELLDSSHVTTESISATITNTNKQKDPHHANSDSPKQHIESAPNCAIVIDSSMLFRNFVKSQAHLFTHLVPLNIIWARDNETISIDNNKITTASLHALISKRKGKNRDMSTSQPTLGQITKVIEAIEKSPHPYTDAFFLCLNQAGSGYYSTLTNYLKMKKSQLKCRYWVFSLNTLFYSSFVILKQLNIWIKSGLLAKDVYKKLSNYSPSELLFGIPTSYRKLSSSGRFNHNDFAKRFFRLLHLKMILWIKFTSREYKYGILKLSFSLKGVAKSLASILQKNKTYQHVIIYYCIRSNTFLNRLIERVKRFNKGIAVKFYLVEMPVCYFALFQNNYFIGLYNHAPLHLPFIEIHNSDGGRDIP